MRGTVFQICCAAKVVGHPQPSRRGHAVYPTRSWLTPPEDFRARCGIAPSSRTPAALPCAAHGPPSCSGCA
eukprot:899351-Alexandrium_andersonii.AAC.1